MAVAHHSCQLPPTGYFVPDVYKFEGAAVLHTVFEVAKSVRSNLHGAVIRNGINFHAARHQLTMKSVVLRGCSLKAFNSISQVSEAAFVVVKFKVGGKCVFKSFHVTAVEGIKQDAVLVRYF